MKQGRSYVITRSKLDHNHQLNNNINDSTLEINNSYFNMHYSKSMEALDSDVIDGDHQTDIGNGNKQEIFAGGIKVGTKYVGSRSQLTAAMKVYYAVRGVYSNEDTSYSDTMSETAYRLRGATMEITKGSNNM
jgi:hypothetical protein